jgi:ABC-type cobalamin/Fe3+-siderophores transport system ATPase subunit
MIGRVLWRTTLALPLVLAGCNGSGSSTTRAPLASQLTPEQRDVQALGREIFDLVDRAVDYRGSHRGRPAASLRQMGVESLTTTTVRRMVNLQREPVITVTFRQRAGREIVSCRGTSQILEEASVNGRYTLMCTGSSGTQRPMEVFTSQGEP